MTEQIAIQTENLSRVYKTYEKSEGIVESIKGLWNRRYKEKMALSATNLTINKGQIVGLVGANGAGKTTLLKLLSGLIYPSTGSARVLGHEPWLRESQFLKKMSILLGQKNQLWWDISPADSYDLLAEIYNLDRSKARRKVGDLAEMLECKHVLHTQLRRLSLGERMKMEIIGALLHSPEVMFLDEPTIGLDIVAQTAIRKFIAEYVKDQGPTIILTSHYMDDIAQLADQLLLISKGQIVYDGTVDKFMRKTDLPQKISFATTYKLEQNLSLPNGAILKSGEQVFSIEVTKKDLPPALGIIANLPGVHDLKFEEADFEEVIHRFLEKESRVLSPSHHNKS